MENMQADKFDEATIMRSSVVVNRDNTNLQRF
jgi:hypothetical protein